MQNEGAPSGAGLIRRLSASLFSGDAELLATAGGDADDVDAEVVGIQVFRRLSETFFGGEGGAGTADGAEASGASAAEDPDAEFDRLTPMAAYKAMRARGVPTGEAVRRVSVRRAPPPSSPADHASSVPGEQPAARQSTPVPTTDGAEGGGGGAAAVAGGVPGAAAARRSPSNASDGMTFMQRFSWRGGGGSGGGNSPSIEVTAALATTTLAAVASRSLELGVTRTVVLAT